MWCDQHLCKQCNKHGDNCTGEHAYCVTWGNQEMIIFCEDFLKRREEKTMLVEIICDSCKKNRNECRLVPSVSEFDGEISCRGFEPEEGEKPTFDLAPNKENDPVNHPSHYTDGKIEVIDFIEDKKLGFHLGNAVKYVARAGKKDPDKVKEDLRKAVWYIERYIQLLEKKNDNT